MEFLCFLHQTIKINLKTLTMETKKTSRANLENKKVIFLQIGFIIALSIALLAFEWRTPDKNVTNISTLMGEDVELLLPVNTVQPKPLPPPPAPKPVININIVDNREQVPDDHIVINNEIRPEDPNPVYPVMQDEPDNAGDDIPFIVVEQQPEFPGGLEALYKFLRDHIVYPEPAKEIGIMGTVYVSFVVERDGSISHIKILRSPHPLLSEEASRVLSIMPSWNPGKQRERAVRVSVSIPIKFSLQK